jgi:hypothetical protein
VCIAPRGINGGKMCNKWKHTWPTNQKAALEAMASSIKRRESSKVKIA